MFWYLAAVVRKCLRKTAVLWKHLCLHRPDTCRQDEDRLSHYQASWRQAVRLKPTGSSCRCCQLGKARLKANQRGCLRALEGNHLGGELFKLHLWWLNSIHMSHQCGTELSNTQQRCFGPGAHMGLQHWTMQSIIIIIAIIIMTNRACLR